MAVFWVLIGALLVALLWTFGAQNSQSVDLQYFGVQLLGAPLWMVAVIPAAVGLLLGFLSTVPGRVRGMMVTRRLRQQVQERERTIGQLQGRVEGLQPVAGAPAALPAESGALPEVPDTATRSRLWQ